jgi:hypothetical protein
VDLLDHERELSSKDRAMTALHVYATPIRACRTPLWWTPLVIGQRVQVGLRYAGQIVTIEVDETTLRVYDQRDHLIKHVPRTSRKEVHRHKAYGHTTNHKTG